MPDLTDAEKQAIEKAMPDSITYNGIEYKKSDKSAGGKMPKAFYVNPENPDDAVLVKSANPEKLSEIVAEALAGRVINRITHLYAPEQKAAVVCAEVFQYQDKNGKRSYSIIQPTVNFLEFFEIMRTGTITEKGERDRSVRAEELGNSTFNLFGTNPFKALAKTIPEQNGLAYALMMAKLVCDDSVHSANLAIAIPEEQKRQFNELMNKPTDRPDQLPETELKSMLVSSRKNGKFQVLKVDWGASLRHFGADDNRSIIISAHHSRWGLKNIKASAQNYFDKYQYFPRLHDDIMKNAAMIETGMSEQALSEIVLDAITELEQAITLNDEQRVAIAQELAMPSFNNAMKENTKDNEIFAKQFSTILYSRLIQLASISLKTEKVLSVKEKFEYSNKSPQFHSPENGAIQKFQTPFTSETASFVEATQQIIQSSLKSEYKFLEPEKHITQEYVKKGAQSVFLNVWNPIILHNGNQYTVEGQAKVEFRILANGQYQLNSIQTDSVCMSSLFFGNKNLIIPALENGLIEKIIQLCETKQICTLEGKRSTYKTHLQIALLDAIKNSPQKYCDPARFLTLLNENDPTGKLANEFLYPPSTTIDYDVFFLKMVRLTYKEKFGEDNVNKFIKEPMGIPQHVLTLETTTVAAQEQKDSEPIPERKKEATNATLISSQGFLAESIRKQQGKNTSTDSTPEFTQEDEAPRPK